MAAGCDDRFLARARIFLHSGKQIRQAGARTEPDGLASAIAVQSAPDIPADALSKRLFHSQSTHPFSPSKNVANVMSQHLSCGFLSWTQYSLLAAPRHVLSTRFGLTSSLTTGLFYIAPATGFLLGTIIGGWFSDKTVQRWIAIRGERLPQDRLNAGMFSFFAVIPFFILLQGWGLQCDECSMAVGGLALPVVTSFCTAAGLLAAFASLNTYCAGRLHSFYPQWSSIDMTVEAIPKKRREIIAGKYMVQYTFAAISSASAVPLIEAVGSGPAGTIGKASLMTSVTLSDNVQVQCWQYLPAY